MDVDNRHDDTLERALQQRIAELEAEVERRGELLEDAKSCVSRTHYEEQDPFYSCPAHEHYAGMDESSECDCGLAKHEAWHLSAFTPDGAVRWGEP